MPDWLDKLLVIIVGIPVMGVILLTLVVSLLRLWELFNG
jgi:hypothetical protein